MKPLVTAGLSGLIFGLGLAVAGMTQADKVINFLDLADRWDPSLALVMGGAIGVHLALYRLILKQPSPLFADRFGIPTRTDIDARLVGGSALFGVGWALGGYCPGPGLVSAAAGSSQGLIFAASMTGGMLLYHLVNEAWSGRHVRKAVSEEPAEPDNVVEFQRDAS